MTLMATLAVWNLSGCRTSWDEACLYYDVVTLESKSAHGL